MGKKSKKEIEEEVEEEFDLAREEAKKYNEIEPPINEEAEIFIRRMIQHRCPKCGIGLERNHWPSSPHGFLEEFEGYCNRCKVRWTRFEQEPEKGYSLWYRPRGVGEAKGFDERISAGMCPKCGIQLYPIQVEHESGRCDRCGEMYEWGEKNPWSTPSQYAYDVHRCRCEARGEGSWSIHDFPDEDDDVRAQSAMLRDNGDIMTYPGAINGYCHKCRIRFTIDEAVGKTKRKKRASSDGENP